MKDQEKKLGVPAEDSRRSTPPAGETPSVRLRPDANPAADAIERKALACPLGWSWCSYKGEVYFAGLNWERSIKAKRLMFDLSYCATAYLAGDEGPIVMKTVAWDPKKFSNIGTVAR